MKILRGSTVYKKGHNIRERTITFGKNNNKVLKFLKPHLRRIFRLTEILAFTESYYITYLIYLWHKKL